MARVALHADRFRRSRSRLWVGTIAATALLLLVLLLAPPPAGWRVEAAELFDRGLLERRAETALVHWRRGGGELDDEPANADNVGPADAYDGLYTGTATAKAVLQVVTFKVNVANGIGLGTLSRPDCGTASLALQISPTGEVSGIALVFGSTCLKTELSIRGRAVDGVLLLRLGSQYLELAKLDR